LGNDDVLGLDPSKVRIAMFGKQRFQFCVVIHAEILSSLAAPTRYWRFGVPNFSECSFAAAA
jgi:hypothetical protein